MMPASMGKFPGCSFCFRLFAYSFLPGKVADFPFRIQAPPLIGEDLEDCIFFFQETYKKVLSFLGGVFLALEGTCSQHSSRIRSPSKCPHHKFFLYWDEWPKGFCRVDGRSLIHREASVFSPPRDKTPPFSG